MRLLKSLEVKNYVKLRLLTKIKKILRNSLENL